MRVFISSTTGGLGSYRQFAADVLDDWHGIDPVFQERLTANHDTALRYLANTIASCDKVICLIGPILGSCPLDQHPQQRRSYTQMEYDIARQSGLPLYVFDGRHCELDDCQQTDEDHQLQKAFWTEIKSSEQRLYPTFRDKADLSKLLLRLIRDWHDGAEPWQKLPTPLVHWRRRMHERTSALASLREALDFATCLAAADAACPQPISVVDAKALLHKAGCDSFLQGLSYEAFAEHYDWAQQMSVRRNPPSMSEIEERFDAVLGLLQALESYLLVHVSRNEDGLVLTVHCGSPPQRTQFFDQANGEIEAGHDGAIYLLDLRRKLSLRLSPHLQSLPGNPNVLCVWWREAGAATAQLLPLAASHDVAQAPDRSWSPSARSPLLTDGSWNALIRQYPRGGRKPGEYCGEWRLLGSAGQSRNLVEIFLATDDGTSDHPAGVWRARDQLSEAARQRVADQFRLWAELDLGRSPWVAPVHHVEAGKQPTIVAAIPAGMRPLARFLASDRSRFERHAPSLRQLVSGVVQVCRQLGRHGVRLLHCSPADLYWDGQAQCQLVGVGATVADGMAVPDDSALWDVLNGNEQPAVAPELLDGAGVSLATEMYAIGILLQRCRHQTALSPLPVGDKRDVQDVNMRDVWRQDPWECLLFHCLAREAGRRFVSWEQFLTYFDRCSAPDARARLTRPETIPLMDGLRISACPISHFQYERFCDDRGQSAPSGSLAWKYAAPFAPVVGVSIGDCEAYCAWLDRQFGGRWRLPTAAEWSAAAGAAGYPWGPEGPEATAANYGGAYRGPTVVGGFPCGDRSSDLRDLAGNVWEWCADLASDGPWRILKGGSFASPKSDLLVSKEDHRIAGGRYVDVGFRVIQEKEN